MVRYSMSAEPRGFTRMETDAELQARIVSKVGLFAAFPQPGETMDQRAERCGLQRRIVNGAP
jgi:hypothetical protein